MFALLLIPESPHLYDQKLKISLPMFALLWIPVYPPPLQLEIKCLFLYLHYDGYRNIPHLYNWKLKISSYICIIMDTGISPTFTFEI